VDAEGKEHRFLEKVPVVTARALDARSQYPQPGFIACQVVSPQLTAGQEVVCVDTERPWGIQSSEGRSRFHVRPDQLIEVGLETDDPDEGNWRPDPPASEESLARLRQQAPVPLPESYFAQLATSNGGEGSLATHEAGWIMFWRAEQVVSHNADYQIATYLPGFFGFGSSGGGELLAFDLRQGEPYRIVSIPFIPMDARHAIEIAGSFDELRPLIGRALPRPCP
jgi:hypothetical protein